MGSLGDGARDGTLPVIHPCPTTQDQEETASLSPPLAGAGCRYGLMTMVTALRPVLIDGSAALVAVRIGVTVPLMKLVT